MKHLLFLILLAASCGRTETWHNSIPRYVMLSLSWRFNVNPKKKSK